MRKTLSLLACITTIAVNICFAKPGQMEHIDYIYDKVAATGNDSINAEKGKAEEEAFPETGPYDQSDGLLVIEALSKVYGDNPDVIGGFIGNKRCPKFLEGMYFDNATLVFQVRGDTIRARRKLEKDSGRKTFRIEKMLRNTFSQKQLGKLMDVLDKWWIKEDSSWIKANTTSISLGTHDIEVNFMMNTPEARSTFRKKIMDSPAIRFTGPEEPVPDGRTGISDTLGIYLLPEYPVYPTSASNATFLLVNRSNRSIGCGAAYHVTYEDEHGVWRQLPANSFFNDLAYGVNPNDHREITANLFPNVHPNKPGRYRMFYDVKIGQREKTTMMAEFRLSDNEEELRQVVRTRIPTVKSDYAQDYDDYVYDVVELMPSFPGGQVALLEYLQEKVDERMPAIVRMQDIAGRVIVKFIVGEDGSIIDPVIARTIDPILDKVAIEIVKSMPKWIPGKQNGKPVKVRFAVPVTFKAS